MLIFPITNVSLKLGDIITYPDGHCRKIVYIAGTRGPIPQNVLPIAKPPVKKPKPKGK